MNLQIDQDDYTGHIRGWKCLDCGLVAGGLTDITNVNEIEHQCPTRN